MQKKRGERSEEEEAELPNRRMKAERTKRVAKRTQVSSVTMAEIQSFWRRKKMEEEDHLLAALKAAARIRARNLKEEDYKLFQASVEEILSGKSGAGDRQENGKELGAIIRDWWTKSKYAYLNQPAIKSMEAETARKHAASLIPNSYSRVLGVF